MLYAVKEKSSEIVRAERRDDRLYLYSEAGMYRLEPKDSGTLRITYTHESFPAGICRMGVLGKCRRDRTGDGAAFHCDKQKDRLLCLL